MALFEPVTHLAFMRAVVASGRKAEHHCGHCGYCGGGGNRLLELCFDSELARVVPGIRRGTGHVKTSTDRRGDGRSFATSRPNS